MEFKKSATIERMLANFNRYNRKEINRELKARTKKIIKGDWKGILPGYQDSEKDDLESLVGLMHHTCEHHKKREGGFSSN